MEMTNKKPTQVDKVIEYVRRYGSITTLDAFLELGVSRLAARISEIEHDRGIPVRRTLVGVKNRAGDTVHVTSYSFEVPNDV